MEIYTDMNNIDALNIIDGNRYAVQNTQAAQTQSVGFDEIYNSQTEDNSLDSIFNKVAEETGVDVRLLKAVAQAESGFDAGAVSYCGAMGIMQLMPSTAEAYGVEDPFDAEQNIRGGAKVLAYLLDDYNGNVSLALAGYNAGCGNVAKYGGVPPFEETINYIDKINGFLGGALSNDSRTLDNAVATDLSGAVNEAAPDVALHGNGVAAGMLSAPIQTSTDMDMPQNTTDSRSQLLSFEEYMYFVETYEKVIEKIFAANKANYYMLSRTSMDSGFNTDAQSVYQAQASMVSPFIERLLNR